MYIILGLDDYNLLTIKTSRVRPSIYMEVTVVDAADGRKVVGTGTADCGPPFQFIAKSINALYTRTSVYTPGKLGRAQPYPNDTMPASKLLQIRPPPESPCDVFLSLLFVYFLACNISNYLTSVSSAT